MAENVFATFRDILISPKQFYGSVQDETSYIRPWLYLSLSHIILQMIGLVLTIAISLAVDPTIGLLTLVFAAVGMFFWIPLYLAIPFIAAGLMHLGLMIFGARQGFYNTFKPICYAGLIAVVYMAINMVIGLVNFGIGVQGITNPDTQITQVSLSWITLAIYLIGMVHALVVATMGVSWFQQITRDRAFFGMILMPVIISAVLSLIFIGLYYALAGYSSSMTGFMMHPL